MAKAVINLQKESGGIVKISSADGTGVTEVTVPESGELVTKGYADGLNTSNVKLTGNQTIDGIKTFSSTITGNISGNAATVTNGVYITGYQTIAGVKTFSSNPMSTATQSTDVNSLTRKDYVDDLVATVSNTASQLQNGWFKDKRTGVMIVWGTASVTGGVLQTVWLPVSMPSYIASAMVTFGSGIADGNISVGATTNGVYPNYCIDVKVNGNAGVVFGVRYIAIGY